MHPSIQITCFFIFAFSFGSRENSYVILNVLIILVLYLKYSQYISIAWLLLKRLKWFLFAIFILYTFFIPSVDSDLFLGFFNTTSIQPILVIVLMLMAANLLLQLSTRDDLLSGFYWLLKPFFDQRHIESILVSVLLVFEYLDWMQAQAIDYKIKIMRLKIHAKQPQISIIIAQLGLFFDSILVKSQHAKIVPITFELLTKPNYKQWIYPIVAIFMYLSIPEYS